MNRIPTCLSLITVLLGTLYGDIRFSVTADRTDVTSNEQIIITATVVSDREIKDLKAPSLAPSEHFSISRTDQNQSQSTSIQIINGKMTQTKEITHQFFYYLTPLKEGAFTFPSLTFTTEGKSYNSQPFSISVSKEPVQNQNVRLNIIVGKRRLYVGEQTILTVQVAQKPQAPVNLSEQGFVNIIESIEKTFGKNFSVSRLFSNKLTRSQTQIGGELFLVYELSFSLVPLKAGIHSLTPIPMEYEVLKSTRRQNADPFFNDFFGGSFFGRGVTRVPKTALSNRVVIECRDLPPPPHDFSGAVGTGFELKAEISPQTVPAGEAATLKIDLKGVARPGNMGEIIMPDMPDFELFTPEKHVFVDTTGKGFITRKSYKYLIIPREEGKGNIPEIKWVYFNPATESYKTLTAGSLDITVTKGKGIKKSQTRYLTQEDIRQVGRDIRYIKTPKKISPHTAEPYKNSIFFILYPLPFLLSVFSVLYRIQSKRRQKDFARNLRHRAAARAMKNIQRLRSKNPSAELLTAGITDILLEYISNRFGFAASGKTLDELKSEFGERKISSAVTDSLVMFIEDLDRYKFGRTALSPNDVSGLTDKVRTIIVEIEKEIKLKKRKKS